MCGVVCLLSQSSEREARPHGKLTCIAQWFLDQGWRREEGRLERDEGRMVYWFHYFVDVASFLDNVALFTPLWPLLVL